MRFTRSIPLIHILVWSALFIVPLLLLQDQPDVGGLPNGFFPVANLYHIGIFYLNAYVLYPRLFNKKWWWVYLLVLAGIIHGSFYLKLFVLSLTDPGFVRTDANERIIFFPTIIFVIISCVFRLVADRINQDKREKDLRAERLDSELKFLRSQISPHFLFNMMTNMVALARTKSDLLEPSLIKLSELLRYMLYQPGKEKLRMEDEVTYLVSYIELQQLRFGDTVKVDIDIHDEAPDCFIEPMLLVPFIENAFKHGIGLTRDPYIHIKLKTGQGILKFSVANNYNSQHFSKDNSSGIGLENVRNRLALLYPGKHTLTIDDTGKQYQVNLQLTLTC
jgi:two-component system, LytTR family, sensor kinase